MVRSANQMWGSRRRKSPCPWTVRTSSSGYWGPGATHEDTRTSTEDGGQEASENVGGSGDQDDGVQQRTQVRKRHVRSSKKTYDCGQCKKRFNKKDHLIRYVRIHTGEKPYICDMCSRRFVQKSALDCHVRTYTGENPYLHATRVAKVFYKKLILVGMSGPTPARNHLHVTFHVRLPREDPHRRETIQMRLV
ncbi:zinc finger protein 84-like [Frankliniella occidentalis]|uniref:Zinc finger protein 84-like n=1 Tax=Frankliniella occidentalis TaxID=133901 RepID=A0A9C6WZP4_FRAOC|nr:zinc finger protein 84-like [Frankliniella occidentalis]